MVYHEDVECPLKVVSCFFEPLGCEHRVYYNFAVSIRSLFPCIAILKIMGNFTQVD